MTSNYKMVEILTGANGAVQTSKEPVSNMV